MPLYEYRCMACRKVSNYMLPAVRRNETVTCRHCGMPARKIFSTPQKPVVVEMTPNEVLRDKETWR